jgi:hypothetical protein
MYEKIPKTHNGMENTFSPDKMSFISIEDLIKSIPLRFCKKIFIISIIMILVSLITISFSIHDFIIYISDKFS